MVALNIVTDRKNGQADNIKSGDFEYSKDDDDRARSVCEYLHKFDAVKTNRRSQFLCAIMACMHLDCVDKDLLCKKIAQSPNAFESISTVRDCVRVIEDVYNRRARSHTYIEHAYLVSLEKSPVFKMKPDFKNRLSEIKNCADDDCRKQLSLSASM